MEHTFDKLKELDLSRDEVEQIGQALKKPEFRKLLTDYVQELQDPENKKLYEEEITQLEKERGVDVTFIHPKPGYVVKTSVNGNKKAFINICANDHIKKPTSSPTFKEGAKGLSWSLPHTLSPPREDLDNKGVRCQVFDIVFHSDTLHLAEKNKAFRNMVNNTALEAVESSFDVKLDKKNLRFPKLSYKGMPHASVIRKPSESKPPERSPEEKEIIDKIFAHATNYNPASSKRPKKTSKKSEVDKSKYTTPKYVIKHRSHIDIQEFTDHREAKMNAAIPKELIVEINLPLLKSSSDITLDVTGKTVQLISEMPAKYKLNLTLPYAVNESIGTAKFDKDMKKLVITLPVKRNLKFLLTDSKDDSGVESDHCSPGSLESDEEIIEKSCDRQLISEDTSVHKPVDKPSEFSEKCLEKSTEFRTKFLDENLHYILPEFTCHVFENVIAFTLNVKNVEQNSVGKLIDNAGSSIHVKFTSVSSSFYSNYYAFLVKFPIYKIDEENTTVEVWDNNLILQIPIISSNIPIKSYLFGVNEETLTEKYVEEPEIVHQILQEANEESKLEKNSRENQGAAYEGNTENKCEEPSQQGYIINDSSSNSSIEDINLSDKQQSHAIDIVGTSYESSGDELSCSSYSPRKNKENCHTSLDSVIPEDGEASTSLKKTVRFNDVVMRQLFRSNSSILGQKKKNQRKAKNKKRSHDRRHSESETSEIDDRKEGDLKDCEEDNQLNDVCDKKEDNDIFHLDIDN